MLCRVENHSGVSTLSLRRKRRFRNGWVAKSQPCTIISCCCPGLSPGWVSGVYCFCFEITKKKNNLQLIIGSRQSNNACVDSIPTYIITHTRCLFVFYFGAEMVIRGFLQFNRCLVFLLKQNSFRRGIQPGRMVRELRKKKAFVLCFFFVYFLLFPSLFASFVKK